jgi:hypothetical protein
MRSDYRYKSIPPSRIATFDIFSIGLMKHHVSALLEFDVTEIREKLHVLRRNGAKVPIPVVIERTNEKSAFEITAEIEHARNQELTDHAVVIHKKPTLPERLYYHMPGFARRVVWKIMLRNPKVAFRKMGNVVITSLGMMGRINSWLIHKSIHPISFGIGSVLRKPVAMGNEIKVREILNMTILVDHDVIDGAPMARMLNDLSKQIESGALMPDEQATGEGLSNNHSL